MQRELLSAMRQGGCCWGLVGIGLLGICACGDSLSSLGFLEESAQTTYAMTLDPDSIDLSKDGFSVPILATGFNDVFSNLSEDNKPIFLGCYFGDIGIKTCSENGEGGVNILITVSPFIEPGEWHPQIKYCVGLDIYVFEHSFWITP